ncbi:MAG: hypothetical protein M3Y48_11385 [Actinomycetota bacterium]|nr:hypothetical protein [Actinomycetota bacterium]
MIGQVAAAVGKGLFAGMVGTAAMTASSTLEAKLRGRKGSTAPLDAIDVGHHLVYVTATALALSYLNRSSS